MVATTQQTVSWKRFRDNPTDLESMYFRWIQPGASAPAISERAEQIYRRHLELAALRQPGTSLVQVYRGGDGLGPAIQIVNDDMPLLVDAVTSALRRLGVSVTEVVHPVFEVLRDNRGRLRALAPADGEDAAAEHSSGHAEPQLRESWMHLQLSADTGDHDVDRIEEMLPGLLDTIRRIAGDTSAMTRTMLDVANRLDRAAEWLPDSEIPECALLLRWLVDGHFTLLGYGRYEAPNSGRGERPMAGSALGVLNGEPGTEITVPAFDGEHSVLRLSNGSADAVLPGSPDVYFVSVADHGGGDPRVQPGGSRLAGPKSAHVFVGTFTVAGSHENILDIPVISRRVHQVIDWAGLALNSFSGQGLLELLQTFPRAELFSTDARRLFETVSAVMNLGLRRQVRLFIRRDERSNALYCLVYLPRDRYSSDVRLRMQDILRREFDADQLTYSARVTESELAVVYFTVHLRPDAEPIGVSENNRERIQELLFATTLTWSDRMIAEAAGSSDLTSADVRDYADAFPPGYRQDHDPGRALADMRRLQALADDDIDTELYRRDGAASGEWRFALYVTGAEVSLSRILPLLHSLGVEVLEEHPYRLEVAPGSPRWIYDFGLRLPAALCDGESQASSGTGEKPLSDNELRRRFSDAVTAMWFGRAEVDGLNELVLRAGLSWRQISVLRAYAKYLRQAGFSYTFGNITRVLLSHPSTARAFTDLFEAYFDPSGADAMASARATATAERLQTAIDDVVSLDTDRILRAFRGLITATLRTNYYRTDDDGVEREYLSLKFDPHAIAELPRPRPNFEIFVYAPRVEGVHLRFGPVARGGLRWSDRLEDFRTEVLGLVKAQAVKNAVIGPVGAKGGFVVKRPPASSGDSAADRQALQAEGVACYRTFISGLLDITDNVDPASGETLPPAGVVRRDGDDTYLVVAADKGTATFSDIANEVAGSYGFWLGDAFASGGSVGYDHKAMGITAKGAWESVKRHFAEMDIDTQSQEFTVVGVGDMSGDVFGNGMLLSEHIRLVAAFDHRNIFLDPNPDVAGSFAERRRLFGLARSSWRDYDESLISAGGGVYDRGAKAIPVSEQVRAVLDLDPSVTTLSPPELIKAILLAPVDLLWNGGIGTYIKASSETHAEVGDKSNDAVRVDADRLRVGVIGEGGNLGATVLGRIEFCRNGGRMNTDALDNSAGVDCSDHEVNIKVLIDAVVSAGELPSAERNALLSSMTDEVSEMVLRDNISQNFRMGLSRAHAASMVEVHRRVITDLENRHGIDRALEALPTDAEIDRRAAGGTGLTSPELANLLAHVKLALKNDLLQGNLLDEAAFEALLPTYFPTPLRERFAAAVRRHPLRRQILATMVVNDMVDHGGSTYAFRLAEEIGTTTEDAVRAYTAAVEIFDLRAVWQRIRTAAVPTAARDELELETKRTLDRASRWLLTNRPQPLAIGAGITRYRDGVRELAGRVPSWRSGAIRDDMLRRSQRAIERGVGRELAEEVFLLIHRFPLLDVLDIADICGREATEVVELYYTLDTHFDVQGLLTAVARIDRGNRWRTLARLAVRDDLYDSLRALTVDVLTITAPADSTTEKIAYWESTNRSRLVRARAGLHEIHAAEGCDLDALSVAARQLSSMVGSGERLEVVPSVAS